MVIAGVGSNLFHRWNYVRHKVKGCKMVAVQGALNMGNWMSIALTAIAVILPSRLDVMPDEMIL